ncbi:MAG: shikimate dehydrogenase [Armatimonadota bacterium]|nr:shikimate dehydrogenase [Armatimonadota bacterium]MDR7557138.1 shikimate dehydrogenase [Armatimonadota bacterium]
MIAPRAGQKVVGIIGDPVAHSLSPRMHTAAFEALGIDWRFVAFRVPPEHLEDALRGIRALGLAGVNVTIPHKQAVTTLVDDLDPTARAIGAVNTVRVEADRLVGYNTDAPGLLDALVRDGGRSPAGARCLVLGAGGAGRSAAFALAGARAASVVILNRTASRADDVAGRVADAHPACSVRAGPLDPRTVARAAEDADVIIQATSAMLGVAADGRGETPAWLCALEGALRPGVTVLDMVYTPPRTALLVAAAKAGARIVDGLSMLVYQGARSFELWTGLPAPIAAMRHAVDGVARR